MRPVGQSVSGGMAEQERAEHGGEQGAKRGLLYRFSFRRRRARADTGAPVGFSPPTPPSPSSSATLGASRCASTSTCSLDAAQCEEDDGVRPVEAARPAGPRAERAEQAEHFGGASDELHRVLLSRLECPVCYLPMAPPIRQCEYGHSVCAGCEARLARCPTCRGAFLAATNATLNAIALAVRLPCRYRGCRALLRLADKARHEERCRHREYPCPNVRCTPWTGTLDDLLQHTLKDHATDTALVALNQKTDLSYTYSRTKPFEISNMDGGVNRVAKSLLLVETVVKSTEELENNKNRDKKKSSSGDMAEESLQPRALFRFHLRFDAKLVVLQSALQYIGPPDNCKLFRYKVSVGSRDGSFKLSSWSEATGEEVDEAVNDGKVLRVDGASFQHLIDKDGRFIVRVKVVVGRLPSLVQPVDNPPAL